MKKIPQLTSMAMVLLTILLFGRKCFVHDSTEKVSCL